MAITAVGLLLVILGWSIPELRATPTLQQDLESPGFGENVIKNYHFDDDTHRDTCSIGAGDKDPVPGMALLRKSRL